VDLKIPYKTELTLEIVTKFNDYSLEEGGESVKNNLGLNEALAQFDYV
jgi:hypothetical protein